MIGLQRIFCYCLIWTTLGRSTVILSSAQTTSIHREDSCGGRDRTSYKYGPDNSRVSSSSRGSVSIIGDVNDVLNGRVLSLARYVYWPARGIVGFGAAAVGPLSGMGEAVMANGFAFVRQTDNKTFNFFQTITASHYRSPFAMFVPRNLKADGRASFSPTLNEPSISFNELYREMSASVQGSPFCFYGLTEFAQLEAIAISKAPIYREPLFGELAGGYYTQPPFRIEKAFGLAFGCAANFSQVSDSRLGALLNRALYVNPHDAGSASTLQVHTHVLTLKDCVKSIEQIHPDTAKDVYHMLSNSTVRFTQASVFKIDAGHKLSQIISRYSY